MSTSVPPVAAAGSLPGQPIYFDVEYPDRELDRLATFFRPIVAIPILIVLGLLLGGGYEATTDAGTAVFATDSGLLVLPTALMIVFRRKYPRWWFEFNRELARFCARVFAYLALLDDRYPSHRSLSARRVRLHRRSRALAGTGRRLRDAAGHRPLSAVQHR
jgi:hypothetical protein